MFHSCGFSSRLSTPPSPQSHSNACGFPCHRQNLGRCRRFRCSLASIYFEERKYIGRRSACVVANADKSSNGVATGAEKRHGRASGTSGKGKATWKSTGAGNRRSLSRKGFDVLEDLMPMMANTVANPVKLEDDPSRKHGEDSVSTEYTANKGFSEGRNEYNSLRSFRKEQNGSYAEDDLKSAYSYKVKQKEKNGASFYRVSQEEKNVSLSYEVPREEKNVSSSYEVPREEKNVSYSYEVPWEEKNVSSSYSATHKEKNVSSSFRMTHKEKNVASSYRVTQEEEDLPSYFIPLDEAHNVARSVSPSSTDSAQIRDVEKPSLSGQQVMWALQRAAIEKAKQKKKQGKGSGNKWSDRERRTKKAEALTDAKNWEDARPIVIKAEWAQQIEDLERQISSLRNIRYPS